MTTTVADVSSTLRVSQTVSYVDGMDHFDLDWVIANSTTSPVSFDFFHAADLFVADDDDGYAYYDFVSGAVGGVNEFQDWYMAFTPETPATHFQEAHFRDIWMVIGWCAEGQCTLVLRAKLIAA